MSSGGSVLVFLTGSRLSGAFNSGGYKEIYRYDVPANTLGCVSCSPAGITPRGNASMSSLHTAELTGHEIIYETVDDHGLSSAGDRIFFESPDPLVLQDSNTNSPPVACEEQEAVCAQGGDVYEWENGVVYLISTGRSLRNSYLLDSSETVMMSSLRPPKV